MKAKDIVIGSIWKGTLDKDFIAIVDEVVACNYQIDVKLTIINTKTIGVSSHGFNSTYFLKAYTPVLTESDLNTEYVKGKTDGYNEGYQYGIKLAKEKVTGLDEEELESEYQRGLKEGKYLEKLDSLNSRHYHYHLGYDAALSESNKPDYKKGLEEGFDKGYNTAIKEMKSDESLDEDISYLFDSECGSDVGYARETYPVTEGIDIIEFIKNNFDNIKSFAQVGDVCSIEFFDKRNEGGKEQLEKELELVERYPHYFKDIRHLNIIDIYRFLDLFGVTDPCIQHAAKKLAVGGKRGAKDYEKDVKEAMDTLNRWKYMQEENKRCLDD